MALIDIPVDAVGEIANARTFNSKTFDMGNNKRRLIQKAGTVVHYDSGFGFEDIDTTLIQQGNDFNVDKAPFQLVVPDGVVGFDYISRRGGTVSLRLTEINDAPIGPLNLNPQLNGNELLLTITPNLDFFIRVRPAQVQIWKIVKNPSAPHVWTWEVTENNPGNIAIQTLLKAWDNQNDLPNTGGRADEAKLRRQASVVTTVTGRNQTGTPYTIREELTNQTLRRDPVTRVKSTRLNETKYPVLIDQDVSEVIGTDADDGFETGDSTWSNNYAGGYSHFGGEGSDLYNWGIRFQTVAVPAGATIDLANVIANVDGFYGTTPRAITRAYSDAVADAAAWSSSSRPSQITKSTAFTVFQPTTTGDKTVTVTDQIQEIIDAGFTSGNDMRIGFITQDSPPIYKNTQMYDYAQGSTNVAELQIDYTVGGVTGKSNPLSGPLGGPLAGPLG